jgi:hypothetical protein
MMTTPQNDSEAGPEVWPLLHIHLENYRDEHEELFATPSTSEDESLQRAQDQLRQSAYRILTSGEVPEDLAERLLDFEPASTVEDKVVELLGYDLVQHRIEFDVTEDVLLRLIGLDKRIQIAALGLVLLLRSDPSPTAVKYYERASFSYLAGHKAECVIMCGAVLESALATRFPDDRLVEAGMKPAIRRTRAFTLGQRMDFEGDHPIFDDKGRDAFWQVINARNDAVHVQPDLADPTKPLVYTAKLLSVMLPRGFVS